MLSEPIVNCWRKQLNFHLFKFHFTQLFEFLPSPSLFTCNILLYWTLYEWMWTHSPSPHLHSTRLRYCLVEERGCHDDQSGPDWFVKAMLLVDKMYPIENQSGPDWSFGEERNYRKGRGKWIEVKVKWRKSEGGVKVNVFTFTQLTHFKSCYYKRKVKVKVVFKNNVLKCSAKRVLRTESPTVRRPRGWNSSDGKG